VGWVYTSVFREADATPVEVFINIGKTGGYVAGAAEVTGRLASRALKYGASLEEIATDLVGISCGTPYGMGASSVLSAFDAVGKSLLEIARSKQLQLPIADDDQQNQQQEPAQQGLKTNGESQSYANGKTNGKMTNGQSVQVSTNTNGSSKAVQMNLTPPSASPVFGKSTTHSEEALLENKFTICPDCSSPVVYAEGCRQCINPTCGWSKCS